MTEHNPDAATARWDAYWQHGFLTSCADAFRGNYSGSIAHYWCDVFAPLTADQVVLDVCTGNGAVAALAAQHSHDQSCPLHIIGIDLAMIEPARALADAPHLLEKIDFRGRTSAAATGLADASVDLVVGQYALEYTPLDATVPEIARVLRPGGRACFILHHDDSVIMTTTREELSHRGLFEGNDTLFDAALALAERVATATTPAARQALASDSVAEARRNRLNETAAAVTAAAQRSAHPEMLFTALNYAKKGYAATLSEGLDAARALLGKGQTEIEANFARLDDLSAASLNATAMAHLRALMHENGLEVRPATPFHHDNSLIGWTLEATKAG